METSKEEVFRFLDLPLELRHKVYEAVNLRIDGPAYVIRDWFDKAEGLSQHPITVQSDSEGDEDTEDDEESDEDEDDDHDANPALPAYTVTGKVKHRPAPIRQRPHTKYRHAMGMFDLSACPPPVELLHINSQIANEAIEHFYKTATLTIHATQGFRHFSFFEETLKLFSDKAYSPLMLIRKCTVRFVWDSELLDGHDIEAGTRLFCEQVLSIRSHAVKRVLELAPKLEELKMEWHDSSMSARSTDLATNILDGFLMLATQKNLDYSVKHFWMNAGDVPDANSLQGKMRVELQDFVDNPNSFC